MPDTTSEARIKVVVEGEEQIKRLTADLAQATRAAAALHSTKASVALADPATAARIRANLGIAAKSSAAAKLPPVSAPAAAAAVPARVVNAAAAGIAARIAGAIPAAAANTAGLRRTLAPALMAPVRVFETAAHAIGSALFGLTGVVGGVAASFPPLALGLTAVAAAATGLLIPLFQVIAGVKALNLSFQWMQEEAHKAIQVRAAARRFFPGVTGPDLHKAEEGIETSMATLSSLIGESALSLQERVQKRMRDVRLGKGLMGDKEAFQRWGISPESRRRFEQEQGKRLDLTDWTRQWILMRERLQKDVDEGAPAVAAKAKAGLADLAETTALLYGKNLATVIESFSSAQFAKLQKNIEASKHLAKANDGATDKLIEFTIASKSVEAAFEAIKTGISRDSAPAAIAFFEMLHEQLIGKLGMSLRQLGSVITIKSWETLTALFQSLVPEVEKLTTYIAKMEPANMAAGIRSFAEGVAKVGSVALQAATALEALFAALNKIAKILPGAQPDVLPLKTDPSTGRPTTGFRRPGWANAVRRFFGHAEVEDYLPAPGAPPPLLPPGLTPGEAVTRGIRPPVEPPGGAAASPISYTPGGGLPPGAPGAPGAPAGMPRVGLPPRIGATGAGPGGVAPAASAPGSGTNMTGVPSQFQADVKALTLAGAKPQNIRSYLQSKGVDVSVATCGQFMASVVKEHGGTPPKNPSVASNWNTFGAAGYSDDPNAINVAVKQGVPTGATGSHVTAAMPIRDAAGNITGYSGIGVNQGKQGVAGVGRYGRDVISSIPLTIGTGRGQYQIRHMVPQQTPGAAPPGGANMAGPAGPAAVPGVSAAQWNTYRSVLGGIESSGRYNLKGGSSGRFSGAYQFGANEIATTARALGEAVPSRQQFLSDPAMQERYLSQYTAQHHAQLMKNPKYAAMSPQEQLAVLGYAHNQGAGGASKWLSTGAVGRDAFGTAGTKYSSAIGAALNRTPAGGPPPDGSPIIVPPRGAAAATTPDLGTGRRSSAGGGIGNAALGEVQLSDVASGNSSLNGARMGKDFGTAAAESFREGVDGVKVPLDPDTSKGVPPRSAPKQTGGDTATDG